MGTEVESEHGSGTVDAGFGGSLDIAPISSKMAFTADVEAATPTDDQIHRALTAAQAGVWTITLDGEFQSVWWSDEVYRIFGLPVTPEPPPVEIWLQHVHPEDQGKVLDAISEYLHITGPIPIEYRIFRATDGALRHLRSQGVITTDWDGSNRRASGVVMDITAITESEAAIAAAQEAELSARDEALTAQARYRLLFEGGADPFLILNDAGQVIDANPAAAELTRYPRAELVGMSIADLVSGNDGATYEAATIISSPAWQGEHLVRRKSGPPIPVESRTSTVQIGPDTVRYMGLRDLSRRRLLERMHQDLIDAVSHDLKNPLAVIQANAQLLERRLAQLGHKSQDTLEPLDSIKQSVGRISTQIEELLEVARLRAGTALNLSFEDCDLVELTRSIAAESEQATEIHVITFTPVRPIVIARCDPARLRRVVSNLLSNAIKYSPEGGDIIVSVDIVDGGQQLAEITVTDHGIGIPSNDIDLIFERFTRGSNVADVTTGSGIGLAGVRHIIQEHGGTIDVESELGRGSTFRVRIPLERPD